MEAGSRAKGKASKENPFDRHAAEYDAWFERRPFAYESEIHAVRELLPEGGRGLEIGVGTGRFAAPLGVSVGLEPSRAMAELARRRGIDVHIGAAEDLPFESASFDFVLMVTVACFLRDIPRALGEAYRVLHYGGSIVVGMIDASSALGGIYVKNAGSGGFFRDAVFLTADELAAHLAEAGFRHFEFRQTIFEEPGTMKARDPVRPGRGEGLFVVIKGTKPLQLASVV